MTSPHSCLRDRHHSRVACLAVGEQEVATINLERGGREGGREGGKLASVSRI